MDADRNAGMSSIDSGPRSFGEHATRMAHTFTWGRPHRLLVLGVLGVVAGAWLLAFLLRFEFDVPAPYDEYMVLTIPFALLIHIAALAFGRVFRILGSYVAVRDVLVILRGTLAAAAAQFVMASIFLPAGCIPRSVMLIHAILTPMGISGLFMAIRLIRESKPSDAKSGAPVPALIVGAGDCGDSLLREIERMTPATFSVTGFIDDDATKTGRLLRGVPVLGGLNDLVRIAKERSVRQVLVALPSAGGSLLREMVGPLLEIGVKIRVLPSINGLLTTLPLLPQLKEVAIEDLLRREPVRLDQEAFEEFIRGRNVLVTGAAGSIGMELCRQILRYRPNRLVALDISETPLHDLMLELGKGRDGTQVCPEMGDVTDAVRVKKLFDKYSPDVVFHAAALKHVPVCEDHPREAVRVNLGGTKIVARQAINSGVSLFVLISTDKAVNPSSVMGATKRSAELLLQELSEEGGPTRFAAVRFGNVLGSNGSVLKIFKSQLERGGPLTVTHPEMRRYFMTIPEAVELVLQAALGANGGEIFELDMGSPVKIVDLAEDFIRLSGRIPGQDIEIKFTGIRPGEKLFEELYCDRETVEATSHPKVFCLKSGVREGKEAAVQFVLDRLGDVSSEEDPILGRLASDLLRLLAAPESSPVHQRAPARESAPVTVG